jgi:hypothetical protein
VDAVDPFDGLQGSRHAAIRGGGHKQGSAPQPRLQLGLAFLDRRWSYVAASAWAITG